MAPQSSPSLLTLPPEILLQILTYLRSHPEDPTCPDVDLAPYSTIHPSLTPLVESLTFELVHLDASKDHDVSKYFPRHAIHRRRAVRMIAYTIPVPISPLGNDASPDGDIGGLHELFTRSIEYLFRELKRWEEEAEPGRLQNRIDLDLRMKETATHQGDAWNTKQPQLRLTRHTLPRLSYIVERFSLLRGDIRVGGSWYTHVAPASVMYLARALGSGLRELTFHTVEMGFSAEDIRARSDFAQAIEETTPYLTGLTKLIITHPYVEPRNHAWTPPPLIPSSQAATDSTSPQLDRFSSALHNLSTACRHLTTLILKEKIILGPEFFWPRSKQVQGADVDGTGIIPSWPHLETFSVALNIVAPSGEWYFSLPSGTQAPSTPSDSESDSDAESYSIPDPNKPVREFLTRLSPRTFTPLLCALTTATSTENMPRLRCFQAFLNEDSRTSYVEILGLGAGVQGGLDNHRAEDGDERRRWYVYLGRDAGQGLVDGEWERDRAEDRAWWGEVRGRWEQWVGETGVVRVVKLG